MEKKFKVGDKVLVKDKTVMVDSVMGFTYETFLSLSPLLVGIIIEDGVEEFFNRNSSTYSSNWYSVSTPDGYWAAIFAEEDLILLEA